MRALGCDRVNWRNYSCFFFFFDTAAPQMAQSRSKIGDYKGDNGGLICRDSKLWARFDTEFCQRVVSLCNFYQYESEREL